MRRLVIAAFTMTVLAACQPATTELTVQRRGEIAAEVTMRLDGLWDALRLADYDQILDYMHQSPDFLMSSNGTFMSGFATLDSVFGPLIENWESQVLTVSETRTVVLSADVVYTMRVGTDAVTLKSGETGRTRPWVVTYVWERRDGVWRVLLSHQSHPTDPLEQAGL